jgi:hypothetical protein
MMLCICKCIKLITTSIYKSGILQCSYVHNGGGVLFAKTGCSVPHTRIEAMIIQIRPAATARVRSAKFRAEDTTTVATIEPGCTVIEDTATEVSDKIILASSLENEALTCAKSAAK